MYNIDPHGTVVYNGVKVPTILCHKDSYRLGLGNDHSDVYTWFNKFGKTMDDVRDDVAALIGKPVVTPPVAVPPSSPNKSAIKVGDAVKLSSDATYYNGKAIPDWVKEKNWVVKSVSGDRVVIDKSTDGKKSICSPVNIKYLSLVGAQQSTAPAKKSVEEIAKEVINGRWGNGSTRKERLTAAGYDYYEVQSVVDRIMSGKSSSSSKKSIDEIAREVINGRWGNGRERKNRLTEAGYDYYEVQNRVEEILYGK
jgi:hypothetical protein